eukprot:COSAG01_NODE_35483_length_531_cov_0.831019_1_plen_53_part_00
MIGRSVRRVRYERLADPAVNAAGELHGAPVGRVFIELCKRHCSRPIRTFVHG